MSTTLPWGEQITVLMELGFPANPFTLDSESLGVLDSSVLDGTLLGSDVSSYATQVRISRGRPDQLQNFNAGVCVIDLNNNDRRFDPINEDSPYWNPVLNRSGVTPRRKVTVFSNGLPLFTGRITDIDVVYEPTSSSANYDLGTVTITAADDFVLLANTFTESMITPVEQLSGSRVEAILDLPEVAYPATRQIDDGVATLGGGAVFEIDTNTNILTYLQNVAASEQGYFFIGADGDLVFTDRIAGAFGVPQAYFSDDGTQIGYQGLEVIYGQEFLYNKVITQIQEGAEQIANDVASQAEYGISTLSLSDLLLSTDAAALALAEDLLGKYKQPLYRFDRLRSEYMTLTTIDQNTVTALEISDVVEITRTYNTGNPSAVSLVYAIEAITHVISPSGHIVEFGLSPTELLFPLTLDDPTLGQLDSVNVLAPPAVLSPFVFDISEFDAGYSFQ
jgi:hypothetical protein